MSNKEVKMSGKPTDRERRRVLRAGLLGIAAIPLARLAGPGTARATSHLPQLPLDNPQAQALNYRHDAAQVPEEAGRSEGEFCDNCQFFQAGDDPQWGGCTIFPQHLVNAKGWCSSWAKKSG